MYEMLFIPAVEYATFFVAWLCLYIFIRIEAFFKGKRYFDCGQAKISAMVPCLFLVVYAIVIFASHLSRNVAQDLTKLIVIFVLACTFVVCITIMLLKQLLGPSRSVLESPM